MNPRNLDGDDYILIGIVKASNGAREVEPDLYKHILECRLDSKWEMSGILFCTSIGFKILLFCYFAFEVEVYPGEFKLVL